MIGLLTQVGERLWGNSRRFTTTTHTYTEHVAVQDEIAPDFRNSDESQFSKLNSPTISREVKEKKVILGDPFEMAIAQVEELEASSDESGQSDTDTKHPAL